MAQQTALEWLQDTWLNYPDLCTYEKIQEWFDRAKAMEKNSYICEKCGHENMQQMQGEEIS